MFFKKACHFLNNLVFAISALLNLSFSRETTSKIWVIKKNQSTEFFLIVIAIYLIISYFLIKVCISNQSNKDPSYIVVDEHLGQAVTLLFCDEVFIEYLFAFLLFRFFDILKPFPINYFDNIKNPFGVIGDDILAGIISGLIILFVL